MRSVSLIIPTLNEAETIGECIMRSRAVLQSVASEWEIIVVDSSDDETPRIAESHGARVVRAEALGYGRAYLMGFEAASGDYIVLMDGDLTYAPEDIPKLLNLLEEGADLAMGSRLRGRIHPGSMPALHRYIGNPLLTWILNRLYSIRVSDAHCGLRAVRRDALDKMMLRTSGMEFASEMLVEASRRGLRIAEAPIDYYPRRRGGSKLRSFSDGWRHLRFMMLYQPIPFLVAPGAMVMALGMMLTVGILLVSRSSELRMHSLILGIMMLFIGYQTFLAGVHFSVFGAMHGIATSWLAERLLSYHSLEKEILLGMAFIIAGIAIGGRVLMSWISSGFGSLAEVQSAMIAMVLSMIGIQTIFSGMLISLFLLTDGREW
ncbi:MAG: glycosyltransferase family 2 protein [Methanothrix sp.]|nr:glycosyltransferase family 2 protein [Methanothrix sp.]MCX8206936.1 glycosyltransferase family 2 protein [Methanothrix sp.]